MAGWFIVRGVDMNLFDPRRLGGFFLTLTRLIVVRDKQFEEMITRWKLWELKSDRLTKKK